MFANQFANHFGLCGQGGDGGNGGDKEGMAEVGGCVDQEKADHLFKDVDTNHNGSIS